MGRTNNEKGQVRNDMSGWEKQDSSIQPLLCHANSIEQNRTHAPPVWRVAPPATGRGPHVLGVVELLNCTLSTEALVKVRDENRTRGKLEIIQHYMKHFVMGC